MAWGRLIDRFERIEKDMVDVEISCLNHEKRLSFMEGEKAE